MSDNQDPPRLYIMMDVSNIRRCLWCGGPAIENPVSMSRNIPYCSNECYMAGIAYRNAIVSAFVLLVIWGGLALIHPFGNLFLLPAILIPVYFSIGGRRLREKAIPQQSRANEQLSVLTLLKSRFPSVKCPSCGENLNLSLVGEDRIFHCQYCDTTGVLEIELAGAELSSL